MLKLSYKAKAERGQSIKKPNIKKLLNNAGKYIKEKNNPKAVAELIQVLESEEQNSRIIKMLAWVYMKTKNHKLATNLIDQDLELHPEDTEFIYYASYTYNTMNNLDKAASFGERCRLRSPEDIRNLINLADIYRKQGNHKRARMILNIAKENDIQKEKSEIINRVLSEIQE